MDTIAENLKKSGEIPYYTADGPHSDKKCRTASYSPNAASSLYRRYTYDILPEIKDRRGATRIKQVLDRLSQTGIPRYDGQPTSILDRDWDNLLILDGCRYDLYDTTVISEAVPKRVSLGSSSQDYIRQTFTGKTCPDIVYITANPHFHPSLFTDLTGKEPGDVFHAVYDSYLDRWNDTHGTVLPRDLLEDVRDAAAEYPDKRKVVHFMQPHVPFVQTPLAEGGLSPDKSKEEDGVWRKAEQGLLDRSQIWAAYRENLEYVLSYARDTADTLSGKTVVTADHGNLVGENGRYGHPSGSDAAPLREVPWHEI